MKLFAIVVCLVAVACAAPSSPAESAALRKLPALQHEEIHDAFGQYAFRYVTAEGTIVSERGRLVPTAEGGHVLVYEGENSHIGPDGKVYVTKYTAGPDGVKFEGDHIPKAPEVPVVVETIL